MYICGPNFIIIGVSINPDADADASGSAPSGCTSSSSIGSVLTGVEGPGEGVLHSSVASRVEATPLAQLLHTSSQITSDPPLPSYGQQPP